MSLLTEDASDLVDEVVVVVVVPSEGEPFADDDGVAEGAVDFPALTVTASFMPPAQCPGTAQMK